MDSQFPADVVAKIADSGIVAVLVIDDEHHATSVAQALLDGGITCMELTLRTDAALGSLRSIRRDVPEMLAGIGTVLTPAQVAQVKESGAAFAVAPGLNPRVIQAAQEADLPFAPGVVTPSDMELALELGCRDTKFFPAEPSGGLSYLATMAAPYVHLGVRYIPLGGVNEQNMADYLASPLVLAVGGSWLAPRDMIKNQQFDEIRQRATAARRIADETRKGGK
jgi:2-dehydro-3-deoxyphosphogluconate aldolase/(4S)-4-hydroxy-2-oxoglutarate aldolase